MTLNDFTPGDLLVLTSRTKRDGQDFEERRAAQVACRDYNGNGLVTHTPPDVRSDRYAEVFGAGVELSTGSGAFNPTEYGADGFRLDLESKRYGLVIRVEKVGHQRPWTPGTVSLFRNPGYDLVNL